MKIAISGKGGVGKTLLAALLSRTFAESGYSVLAIDADPCPSLAATLGFPHAEDIVPISEMQDLVEERTGAKPGEMAVYFKLNPRVDDLPEKYWREHEGVKLMVMGQMKRGGAGCYCAENVLLQSLANHLLLARNEVIIMDMEAGIEHLTRATAKAVDKLIVVVEPGRRSVETAFRVRQLAEDIGIRHIAAVGNKIKSEAEKNFLISSLKGFEFLGFIPYDQAIVEADLSRSSVVQASRPIVAAVKDIFRSLVSSTAAAGATKG